MVEEMAATQKAIREVLEPHKLRCHVSAGGPCADEIVVTVGGLASDDDRESLRHKLRGHLPDDTSILSGDKHTLILEGGDLPQVAAGFQQAFAG